MQFEILATKRVIPTTIDAPDIISAIVKLHQYAQRLDDLEPDAYRIVKMEHVYGQGGEVIRSEYPVVGGPNPDHRKPSSD